MNDPGINGIYFIKQTECSFKRPTSINKIIHLPDYISGVLTELEFEPDTFILEDKPERTRSGVHYNTIVSFTISGVTPTKDALLKTLEREPHIFVFSDNENQHHLMGTAEVRTRLGYKKTEINPPNSAKNYKVTITLESTHGLIFCTIA